MSQLQELAFRKKRGMAPPDERSTYLVKTNFPGDGDGVGECLLRNMSGWF